MIQPTTPPVAQTHQANYPLQQVLDPLQQTVYSVQPVIYPAQHAAYGPQVVYPQPQYPPQHYHPQQIYPQQQYLMQVPPQQQYFPQYIPPQVFLAPLQSTAPQTKPNRGFDRLAERDGIFIKQKFSVSEALSGCEKSNTYYVYPMSKAGEKKGKKLFVAQEKSTFLAKQCMTGDCRPFHLKVNLQDENEELDNEPFLLLERPCKCTFYCLNRPEMKVAYVEDGKNKYIGKIRDPWTFCNAICEIYDKDNKLVHTIDGSCLQIGMHCGCPCETCQAIDFDVKSPSGEIVSSLQKTTPGCARSMVAEADTFSIRFPGKATKETKALIMCSVFFLDFRYFEHKSKQIL